ncbi:hypothetical protein LTR22_028486 [Elasticomyces elasticus]|nr:hypothetical protein LTR22_028486 [Elasticomyces elasticus]
MDRRVKAVLSQIPLVNLIRPDIQPALDAMFQQGRLACMASKEHGKTPVVHEGPLGTSSMPSADNYQFLSMWGEKSNWKNEVAVRGFVKDECGLTWMLIMLNRG